MARSQSDARHVDAQSAVADEARQRPIVGDAHGRVAADEALPLLARVVGAHGQGLLGGAAVG